MKKLVTSILSINVSAEGWKYSTTTDKMSGKKTQQAYIVSENSLNLGFPYTGTNYGRLSVRQHPEYGLDVIFTIQQGQILCDVYTCGLKIRFDEDKVENFTMLPAADHSSTVVFAKHPQWAIDKLKKANSILVQAQMYQEGA